MAAVLKDRLARQASGDTELNFDPTGRDEPRLLLLSLSLIDRDPNQPRRDLGDLADLALSIKEHGVLQPILVESAAGGRFRIVAGERRFAACQSLGMETIPCIVRTVEPQFRLALQIIENIQRKDLLPIEEAQALRQLMEEFNLSQHEIARRIGRSVASVNQTLRILDLSPEVISSVRESGVGNKSVLLEIAKEPDPTRQQALWQKAKKGELTVRKARAASSTEPKQRQTMAVISLPEATVQVRFLSGEATPERIVAALKAALERQPVPI
jgi:ParB family chromosome partitioning protein